MEEIPMSGVTGGRRDNGPRLGLRHRRSLERGRPPLLPEPTAPRRRSTRVLVFGLEEVWKRSIMRQSIETMRSRRSLPSASSSLVMRLRAASASRQAAHSSAEPRAISRKRQRSAEDRFPLPSAMLFAIDWLASSKCFVALMPLFFSDVSRRSPTQAMNSIASR
jgi:hypothetical protein